MLERPILPGWITIEGVASSATNLYIGSKKNFKSCSHIGYLASVNKFKFLKLVISGDTTIIEKESQNNPKLVQTKIIK